MPFDVYCPHVFNIIFARVHRHDNKVDAKYLKLFLLITSASELTAFLVVDYFLESESNKVFGLELESELKCNISHLLATFNRESTGTVV